ACAPALEPILEGTIEVEDESRTDGVRKINDYSRRNDGCARSVDEDGAQPQTPLKQGLCGVEDLKPFDRDDPQCAPKDPTPDENELTPPFVAIPAVLQHRYDQQQREGGEPPERLRPEKRSRAADDSKPHGIPHESSPDNQARNREQIGRLFNGPNGARNIHD